MNLPLRPSCPLSSLHDALGVVQLLASFRTPDTQPERYYDQQPLAKPLKSAFCTGAMEKKTPSTHPERRTPSSDMAEACRFGGDLRFRPRGRTGTRPKPSVFAVFGLPGAELKRHLAEERADVRRESYALCPSR